MTQMIAAPEAERVLVGSVLRDPDVLDDALSVAPPDTLVEYPLKLVYQAAIDLRDAKRHVDAEAVYILLKSRGQADELGANPPMFLGELLDHAPTAANLEFAANEVRNAAVLRKAKGFVAEFLRDVASPTGPAEEMVEGLIRRLTQVADQHAPADGPEHIRDVLARALRRYEANDDGDVVKPITTGFAELDEILDGGFRKGELAYVGARAGVGKSALLLRFIEAAARSGAPVLVHGLEMSNDEVNDRQNAASAGVPLSALRGKRKLTTAEWTNLVELMASGKLGDLPIHLDQRPRMTVARIASTARRYVRKYGVKVLVVDYLQLVEPENRKVNRHEQVSQISRDLKVLAGELGLVVMCAVQLNRLAAEDEPELHHLKESGSLEQDGNIVMLLHRPSSSDPHQECPEYVLKVPKQRNGIDGVSTPLVYRRSVVRFEEPLPRGVR